MPNIGNYPGNCLPTSFSFNTAHSSMALTEGYGNEKGLRNLQQPPPPLGG